MRLRALLVALVVASALLAAGAAQARAPVAVGVGLKEFRVSISRPVIKPGKLKLVLNNRGEDVHDIAVKRGSKLIAKSRAVGSEKRGTLRLTLRKSGRYTLVCLIADHAKRGMRATLRVRK